MRIPAGLDARAALYRSVLADRRVLILLDDARDTGQVLPLLPGGARCMVLVTARDPLTDLVAGHGARTIPLDALSADDARRFLCPVLGHARLAAEEQAALEIIERCARFPLALSTVAAHAATRPSRSLSELVHRIPEILAPVMP